MESFADKLQIKIRETGQINKEFAKGARIKKKDLDSILDGEKPDNWTLKKIANGLGIDIEEIESWIPNEPKKIIPINRKFVKTDFKKKVNSPLKASGRFCIRCFFREKIYVHNTVEMAHFQGDRSSALGKGRGIKCSDIMKAPLCKKCHNYFDIEIERKSIEKSEEFLFYISLFIVQEFEAGNIIIKDNQ